MSTTNKTPEAVLTRIRSGERFLLTSHINPDGDAIGSAIGLARILRSLGKGATIWMRDAIPKLYQPLPGTDRVHYGVKPPAGFPDVFDTVVVLECPSLERSGLDEHLDGMSIVNIDHHLGNAHYGEINWIEPAAPAVGEMVHRLAQGLMATLDPDTATSLFMTLVTDTGGFRFANATPEAFEASAALVRDGARPEQVAKWIYESQPVSAMRLLGEMLGSLEMHVDGRVASVVLSRDMFANAGADESDTEGLVDYPRSIAGVDAVVLLRELAEGGFKASLRSRGDVDVEKIARRHGGGGHRNAAGFTLEGTGEQLRADLVGELGAVLAADEPAAETA